MKFLGLFVLAVALSAALISCSQNNESSKGAGQEDPAAKAKMEAESAECLTNLARIGKACRAWADSHTNAFARDFIMMTNELGSWKILQCPGDHTRDITGWAQVKTDDVSYKITSMGPAAAKTNLDVVILQCNVHGHICLADGSVLPGSAELQRRLRPEGDGSVHLAP